MKYVSDALNKLLMSQHKFYMTELYTIRVPSFDTPLRLTSLDIDVRVDDLLYKAAPISRSSITETVGTSVDELEVTWHVKQTDFIPGTNIPIIQQMRRGLFDSANLQVDRLFSPDPWVINMPSISSDYLLKNRFSGLVNVESVTMLSCSLKISSPTKLLDVDMPRNLYEASCNRVFCSTDCGVNIDTITETGATLKDSTTSEVNINVNKPVGYFNQGVILFLDGNNAGLRRGIRSYANGTVRLKLPLPVEPNAGSRITIYPGCPKTREACAGYGSQNFRGFTYIPVPETSV